MAIGLDSIGSFVGDKLFGRIFGFVGVIQDRLWAILLVGALAFYYFKVHGYNKKVVLRKIVGNKVKILEDTAKVYVDKDGVHHWKLKTYNLGNTKIIDAPPDDVKDILATGKEYAEGYVTESGQIIWRKDTFNLSNYMKENMKEITITDVNGHPRNLKIFTGFQPISTTQRASFARQMENVKRYTDDWWKNNMPMLVLGGSFVIIILAILFFGGKIITPANELARTLNTGIVNLQEYQELQNEQTRIIERIEKKLNVIEIPEEENQGTPIEEAGGAT